MSHPLSALIWLLVADDIYYAILDAIYEAPRYSVSCRAYANFINQPDALTVAHSLGYRLTHCNDDQRLLANLYQYAL